MAKCPYCEGEMKAGVIEVNGGGGAIWEEENKKNFISKVFNYEGIVLKGKGFIKNRIEANYCAECKKIIIDIKE